MKTTLRYLQLSLCLVLFINCTTSKEIRTIDNNSLELAKEYSENKSGEALLVWADGDLILEDYHNNTSPEKRYALAEVSTLFSGLIALAARDDGLLKLDEPVSATITEWQHDPYKSSITISQLLHLTSGITPGSYKSMPPVKKVLKRPLIQPPGQEFRYGPIPFQVFGLVIHEKGVSNYLKDRILNPIGIEGGYWKIDQEVFTSETNSYTIPRFFDGSSLTAEELGRVGKLLLNQGKWKGKTIINDISPLTQPSPASPGYGLGVWLNKNIKTKSDSSFISNLPDNIMLLRGTNKKKFIYDKAPSDLYMAAGRLNQRLYIIPSKDIVIVRLGGADLRWSDAKFLARLLNGQHL
ncbi:CubicO group peptidase, beta-lactamase class C family [Fodinibius salinus]|uniref:CubicO group peptidase, beta-lactamase class C family n=1 Tax=Fodinibius salinus TaxID=860790 RepID=A0A5D3YNU2_9BACT|nr:serine hydrolase [Fodinibius salinus]TYP94753.1 CubicO group peptidase, beta-lactamase class C family [Fodinibius salinus]